MEYKFKKGDRVVAVMDYISARKGETYFIGNLWSGNYMSIPLYKDLNNEVFVCYADGKGLKPAEPSAPLVKIAVSFENDSEKMAYLRYCDSIGKVWHSGYKPSEFIGSDCVFTFDYIDGFDGITQGNIDNTKACGHEAVPFKVFATLKGIDYTPVLEVKLNDEYTAVIENGKVKVGCQTFEFERIEALYNAVKEATK
jgi:hypothetical protein